MTRIITRRSMLASAAVGLPAVAAGSTFFGRSNLVLGAPPKAGKSSKWGPAGPAPTKGTRQVQEPLRPVAELVLQKARHAFTVAAAEPKRSFAKGGMAAAAARFLRAQPGSRTSRASGRALTRLSAQGAELTAAFGPYAKLKGPEFERALSPGEKYKHGFELVVSRVKKAKTARVKVKREKPKEHNPDDYKAKPRYERIEFHLNSVSCVEDTNEFDSDEIRIGGQLIRPDGNVVSIASHLVHDNFDPGTTRNYDSSACIGKSREVRESLERLGACNGKMSDPWAGRVLASAPLDPPWPGTFGLVVLMVEEDHGGMNELLTELYGRIKDELEDAIAELGQATGDVVAEYLGEDMGAIINEIVVWVLTELVAWVVSLFDNVDDPIDGRSWMITLPNRTKEAIDALASGGVETPDGTRGSAIETLTFSGDGGKYKARIHWRALS